MSPRTCGCRSKEDQWSHPPAPPSQMEGVMESRVLLEGVAQGPWGSLKRGYPRWCAPFRGGSSIPVHFPGQHEPPIPPLLGRKESKVRDPKGEILRCFGEAVLR